MFVYRARGLEIISVVAQLRKINVVSIESQNLHKPLSSPAQISRVGTQETRENYSTNSRRGTQSGLEIYLSD